MMMNDFLGFFWVVVVGGIPWAPLYSGACATLYEHREDAEKCKARLEARQREKARVIRVHLVQSEEKIDE